MSLSKCYSSLLDSMNAEIRIRWLQIVVRNDYYPDLHRVRRFLESQVRAPCTSTPPYTATTAWASGTTRWGTCRVWAAMGGDGTPGGRSLDPISPLEGKLGV